MRHVLTKLAVLEWISIFLFPLMAFADTPAPQNIAVKSANVNQINGSTLSLGQTTMSSSLPVTIASNQSAVPASQSGSWSVAQSGTWTTGRTWTLLNTTDSVNVGNFPATQPISAVSLPLPTGAATAAGLTTINTTLGSPFQAGGSIGNTVFGATQSGTWTSGRTWTLGYATDSVTSRLNDGSGNSISSTSNNLNTTIAKSSQYVQGSQTVTTIAAEAKVGGSRLTNRQTLSIYNGGVNTIYVGPSGVTTSTGRPIYPYQFYSTDDANLAVYLIAGSSTSGVIVEEKGL